MSVFREDLKRVRAFRRELIASVPRFPNDGASLQMMETKSLLDLMIAYIGWRVRYVAPRPRTIAGLANLLGDPKAIPLRQNIQAFVSAVENGSDLTPYLSLEPHTRGYTPAADSRSITSDTWADKDFLLNVMGLHHFHLGLAREAKGHMARTDDVLFASVTRAEFEILGLFDHSAFEDAGDDRMTPERDRLWSAFSARQEAGLLPGQLALDGFGGMGITLGGQPLRMVLTAQHHLKIMREIEPQLDDHSFVLSLYADGAAPKKPKPRWFYNHLDFGLLDESAKYFMVLARGPN